MGGRKKKNKVKLLPEAKLPDKQIVEKQEKDLFDWINLDLEDEEWATKSVGVLERDKIKASRKEMHMGLLKEFTERRESNMGKKRMPFRIVIMNEERRRFSIPWVVQ